MAHLILLRSVTSFVQPVESVYGEHERIELAINSRRYEFNGAREGYNIPHAVEWKIMEYRMKKECIPEFVRDLGGVVLNPEKNKVSLWKIIRRKGNCKANEDIARGTMFAQWLFKWFNRVNKVLRLHPIQPVPTKAEGEPKPFSTGWNYTFIVGVLPDIETDFGEEL